MDGLIAYALAKKYTDEHGGGEGATKTFSGSGAPTSSIAAKKGDLYLDTDNNQVYICTNYISSDITDLTGISIKFHSVLTIPMGLCVPETSFAVNFTLKSSQVENSMIFRTNFDLPEIAIAGQSSGAAYADWRASQGYDPFSNQDFKEISFTGGTDATNEDLISFIKNNSEIEGVGSTWDKITANLFEGTTEPSNMIVAKKGDTYFNKTTKEFYICINYVDINNITDLAGLTVVFKNTNYDKNKLAKGETLVNFNNNNTTYDRVRNLYDWNQLYYGEINVNNFQGWTNQAYRTVTFTGGTGATNADFISWVISFADSISGTGSTWTKIIPELPSEVAPDTYIYSCDNTSGTPVYGWYSLSVLLDNYFINKSGFSSSVAEGAKANDWSVVKDGSLQVKFSQAIVPPPSNE